MNRLVIASPAAGDLFWPTLTPAPRPVADDRVPLLQAKTAGWPAEQGITVASLLPTAFCSDQFRHWRHQPRIPAATRRSRPTFRVRAAGRREWHSTRARSERGTAWHCTVHFPNI